ncbi:MAG: alpha-mannosidase [Candidatus Xenobiia bacterium LiM19]
MDVQTVFLVPHTHWDREWYLPYETFRKKLIDFLDSLLVMLHNHPLFTSFVLDGQAVILEDYLEFQNEREEQIAGLIKDGRLLAGPWYTLPDEFLTSGESLIRNLLMGHLISQRFGRTMKIGYIPDSFGHIAQMPQILAGFGIDHCIFTRGTGDQPRSTEYRWEGSDGTSILATQQIFAYNNAGYLPRDKKETISRIISEVDKLKPYSATPHILLNCGGDHSWPDESLVDAVAALREMEVYPEIRISGFEEYSRSVKESDQKEMPLLKGELRESRYYPILSGVSSNKMRLKLMNHNLLSLLERKTEPYEAIAMTMGREYPYCFLAYIWRLILQNHAHDSICGCCIDEVYDENIIRFEKAQALAELLKAESLAFMTEKVNTAREDMEKTAIPVVVFNSLPSARKEPVTIKVSSDAQIPHYRLVDCDGAAVPLQRLAVTHGEGKFPFPSRALVREDRYVFPAEVPPLGYCTYYLLPEQEIPPSPQESEDSFIENEYYIAGWDPVLHLYVQDKRTGIRLSRINQIIDEADCGDEYNFSPLPGDMTLLDPFDSLSLTIPVNGPVLKTLQLKGELKIPSKLSKDRASRTPERVSCPFSLRLTLFAGIERIDCSLKLENRAQDHRLRISFPSELKNASLHVETPFDLTTRPLEIPSGQEWIEVPSPTLPHGRLLVLSGDTHHLALFNRGIPEYEIKKIKDKHSVILTLLRCVGWLSRQDIIGRKVEAGPKISTPKAQSKELYTFDYSLVLTPPDRKLETFLPAMISNDTPLDALLTGIHSGELPQAKHFVSLEPAELAISSLKKAERNENLIMRFYNPTDLTLNYQIKTGIEAKGFYPVSFLEEREGGAKAGLHSFDKSYPIGPKKIITVEIDRN